MRTKCSGDAYTIITTQSNGQVATDSTKFDVLEKSRLALGGNFDRRSVGGEIRHFDSFAIEHGQLQTALELFPASRQRDPDGRPIAYFVLAVKADAHGRDAWRFRGAARKAG